MFCTKCGKDNGDNNKFCIECGNPLEMSVEESSNSAPVSQSSINESQNPWQDVSDGTTVISEMPSMQNENKGSDIATTILKNSITLVDEADGTEYCIDNLPKTIGKGSKADCIIPGDEAISRVQATIHEYNNGKFVIEDMNSTNKTYLNGNVLEPEELVVINNGDKLKLGKTEFTIKL